MDDSAVKETIPVEVAYALPQRQLLMSLEVVKGCTAMEAVRQSGIISRFPDLNESTLKLGIFSRPLDDVVLPGPDKYQLEANDRVEIYRPLLLDPKEARMERVRREREEKAKGSRKEG